MNASLDTGSSKAMPAIGVAVSTSLNASLAIGSSEAMPAIVAAVSTPLPASIAAGSSEARGEPHSLAGSSLVGSDAKTQTQPVHSNPTTPNRAVRLCSESAAGMSYELVPAITPEKVSSGGNSSLYAAFQKAHRGNWKGRSRCAWPSGDRGCVVCVQLQLGDAAPIENRVLETKATLVEYLKQNAPVFRQVDPTDRRRGTRQLVIWCEVCSQALECVGGDL
jgi:hypothetical protein